MGYYVVGNNISITRGDSAVIALEITDTSGRAYIISDGDQLTMTVKASIDDVVPVIVKTLDHGIVRGNDAVEIHIDPQDTACLRYGDYIYDVELVMADGYTDTVIPPSQLTITGEVTTHD